MEISEQDFRRLVYFVKNTYGIDLSKKKQLMQARLSSTLVRMGMQSFREYVDYILKSADKEAVRVMLNRLTTNYTYFMREEAHFRYFRETVLPYLLETRKERVLSIWSAGCSSGEEPYTISMLLKEALGTEAAKWDTRVLATDISQQVLEHARRGVYEEEGTEKLPPAWRKKYFLPDEPGKVKVTREIRENVIYREFNLMDPIRFRLKFDVIFCRNVMIYFDQKTKTQLVQRFCQATNPGGYLMIGHSEGIDRKNTRYQYVCPAVYRKM